MVIRTEQQKAEAIARDALSLFKPKPKLTVSEMADNFRVLSRESCPTPGKWRTDFFPYLKEIMDCFSEPMVEQVVVMSSSQIGKTEIISNVIFYFSYYEPSPILLMMPTESMAETYSQDRLAPMIRDSPVLRTIFCDPKSRSSGNKILYKQFTGGQISMIGANSPTEVSGRPIRVVLIDEEDRNPTSAGGSTKGEGDSGSLAIVRTKNFWNRKIGRFSTPNRKETSKIYRAFQGSDQRYRHVPCPHCYHKQKLVWEQIKWEDNNPKDAWYECINCQAKIQNKHKAEMNARGEWIAEKPFTKIAGFHIWEAYSPLRTFGDIVVDFLDKKDDPEQYHTWVNTSLGLPYEEEGGEIMESAKLQARAEPYKVLTVPTGGLILTAGVDVQRDRLVIVIRAWGRDEESWLVYYQEIWGDPFTDEPWEQLSQLLQADYPHASGAFLKISLMAIDSGDGVTQSEVYNYCRENAIYGVIAIKGASTPNKPIVSRPTMQDFNYKGRSFAQSIRLYLVGADTATATIYGRLALDKVGRGYYHFPIGLSDQYYDELTSEKLVTEFNKGIPKKVWKKLPKRRNEVLDCEKYALAAAYVMGINLEDWDWEEEELKIKVSLEKE